MLAYWTVQKVALSDHSNTYDRLWFMTNTSLLYRGEYLRCLFDQFMWMCIVCNGYSAQWLIAYNNCNICILISKLYFRRLIFILKLLISLLIMLCIQEDDMFIWSSSRFQTDPSPYNTARFPFGAIESIIIVIIHSSKVKWLLWKGIYLSPG